MNTKNTIIAISLVLVGVFATLFFTKDTVVNPIREIVKEQVGAAPGTEHSFLETFNAGIQGTPLKFISTTTVVAFNCNPSTATTTFQAAWSVPVSTTTTTVLAISTSTYSGRFATTTAILSTTIAANKKGAASYVGANSQNLLGPSECVQLGYGAGTTLAGVAQQQTGTFNVSFNGI